MQIIFLGPWLLSSLSSTLRVIFSSSTLLTHFCGTLLINNCTPTLNTISSYHLHPSSSLTLNSNFNTPLTQIFNHWPTIFSLSFPPLIPSLPSLRMLVVSHYIHSVTCIYIQLARPFLSLSRTHRLNRTLVRNHTLSTLDIAKENYSCARWLLSFKIDFSGFLSLLCCHPFFSLLTSSTCSHITLSCNFSVFLSLKLKYLKKLSTQAISTTIYPWAHWLFVLTCSNTRFVRPWLKISSSRELAPTSYHLLKETGQGSICTII